jgi:isopenicillin N synthase-like dioxygenase
MNFRHSKWSRLESEVEGVNLKAMFSVQVVKHGIPLEVLDEMLEGVRRFNESEVETKKKYYTRDVSKKVVYNSNFDLYEGPAANWRDTMLVSMAPEPPNLDELPVACR